MKKEILKLRSLGYTYNEIVKELGCAKSTVSYHCGDRQSEKHLERVRKRRKDRDCPYCGKHVSRPDSKFCNVECYQKYQPVRRLKLLEDGRLKSNNTIRKVLIEKHGEFCFECDQGGVWNNKPLMLQVDHIDGDSDNNKEDNLRLLCPNCHTQTDTFCGGGTPKDTKRNIYLRKYKTPPSSSG